MKRVAHYRNGRPGRMAGMSEKCYWYLASHNNTATGAELAAFLKISLPEFNNCARVLTRNSGMVANITASATWKTESGIVDRRFTLNGKPKFVAPQPTEKQYRYFTKRSAEYAQISSREICIAQAQRRAQLIAAGLYIDELEAAL
ncbi:hypothetical protein ABW09_24725 [Pluralibacter gergoviae]|uniref:hypothetical protein n=1 Tax=Pluralibacter gergoviae TaxID=61647 RepID=UPI000651E31B|nr:hypothetical protein [Pluralibacter gergoviae]KMK11700.1 hypothetical protein ABW09_24725 [Pluralibacter gergoviae]